MLEQTGYLDTYPLVVHDNYFFLLAYRTREGSHHRLYMCICGSHYFCQMYEKWVTLSTGDYEWSVCEAVIISVINRMSHAGELI